MPHGNPSSMPVLTSQALLTGWTLNPAQGASVRCLHVVAEEQISNVKGEGR